MFPMRHGYSSISPTLVHQLALRYLQRALPWKPLGRSVSVCVLLHLLLILAVRGLSLFEAVRRRVSFSIQSGYMAVQANLLPLDQLTAALASVLHDVLLWSRR